MIDDDDLKEMLNEIESYVPPGIPEEKKEIKERIKKPEISVSIKKEMDDIEEEETDLQVVRKVALPTGEDQESPDDIRQMLSKYRSIFDKVVEQCDADRNQVQSVVDHFMDVVNTEPKIPSVYIEKFPELLKTKNDIAVTAIRALDSFSKLLSASKGSDIMNVNNMNFDVDALTKLLEQDEKEED